MLGFKLSRACFLIVAAGPSFGITPAAAIEVTEMMRAAIRLPCLAQPGTDLRSLAERLPLARPTRNWVRFSPQGIVGRRMAYRLAGGDELIVDFAGPTGHPQHVTVRHASDEGRRPVMVAIADHSCTIHTVRRLRYDEAGRAEWLDDLDSGLRPIGAPAPLNPPVPPGEDPPGLPVGLVDTGVNYLLPEIAARLARGPDGQILGYDFWELDRRPFDIAPTRDPFFPDHHGTRTASLVLQEAPVAKLIPYRYPRDDMARMTALVEDAATHGVRIMNLSVVSRDRDAWRWFHEAARRHPEMLFVVAAGNDDSNLEQRPVYPAALTLDNMVVVTSATTGGRLTHGVSWGPKVVHLMVPGEDIVALDFDGQRRPVSGSSYATARISALAACLLAGHPQWPTAELKAAIFREAQPDQRGEVAAGFVPNAALGNRGACKPLTLSG